MLIVLVFIIYLAYTFIYMTSSLISKPMDLKSSGSRFVLQSTSMKQPGSTKYNYEMWVYVESNFPSDSFNVLMNRGNLFAFALLGNNLSLYVNPIVDTSGSLTPDASPLKTVEITKSFPFQKWTQIYMNVDGDQVDLYLDGKLMKTKTGFSIPTDRSTSVNVGNAYTIGKLTRFSYWPSAVSPQEVWKKYMIGNSSTGANNYLTSYKADMAIFKDNQSVYKFSLL